MKLIIEPDDGVSPLLSGIKNAKESIDLTIFRFDYGELDMALEAAVGAGVKVNALVASVNHGGEKSLRKLEMRFLEAGVTVARTSSELTRYHNKLIVIDRRILYVLSFNFTHLDIDRSRGFGILTEDPKLVAEGINLLEADSTRTPYSSGLDSFVVSPCNARNVLGDFLKRAHKQLLIYDPKISDEEMIRILHDRAEAGVEIRVIGQTEAHLPVRVLPKLRLHTRMIIRDGHQAFIGSQSLRTAELDSRREVGIIVHDANIVRKLMETFESDWASSANRKNGNGSAKKSAAQDTEQAMKVLIEELHPIATTVKRAVQKVVSQAGEEVLEDGTVKETVAKVVKKVVKQAVKEAAKV
ncbi:MAG: phospholipase D-like domain-containing protein [Candidatus Acidiferrales bacterium]